RCRVVSHLREGYCWSTSFKVLGVLFLGEVHPTFLPSKKACWAHQFQYLGVDQQYREGFQDTTKGLRIPHVSRLSLLFGSATVSGELRPAPASDVPHTLAARRPDRRTYSSRNPASCASVWPVTASLRMSSSAAVATSSASTARFNGN